MRYLAIGVPTYKRSDVMEELLIRFCELYDRMEIDLYIYDSSPDRNTEKIVVLYQKRYTNLFYKRIDHTVHSNLKVYMIYQDFALKNYRYIWVCSDSIRFSCNVLEKVRSTIKLSRNYDFIIVNCPYGDKMPIVGNKEFYDPEAIFSTLAWYMILYGAVIINKSMIENVDWKFYVKRYCVPDKINFSHVCFFFTRLLDKENVKVLNLQFSLGDLTNSPYKKKSGWYKESFKLWCEYWPKAILSLPDFYNRKKGVVIQSLGRYSCTMGKLFFLEARIYEIYTLNVFFKYLSTWRKIISFPIIELFVISILPKKIIRYFFKNNGLNKDMRKKILKFNEKYSHIYIYGCGDQGGKMATILTEMGLGYKGFIVSDINNEKKFFLGHPVVEYNTTMLSDDMDMGIIIAVNEKNYKEIIDGLPKRYIGTRIVSGFELL